MRYPELSSDARFVIILTSIVVLIATIGALVIMMFTETVGKLSCTKYESTLKEQTRYIWFDTCYVKNGNYWLTKNDYNYMLRWDPERKQ